MPIAECQNIQSLVSSLQVKELHSMSILYFLPDCAQRCVHICEGLVFVQLRRGKCDSVLPPRQSQVTRQNSSGTDSFFSKSGLQPHMPLFIRPRRLCPLQHLLALPPADGLRQAAAARRGGECGALQSAVWAAAAGGARGDSCSLLSTAGPTQNY